MIVFIECRCARLFFRCVLMVQPVNSEFVRLSFSTSRSGTFGPLVWQRVNNAFVCHSIRECIIYLMRMRIMVLILLYTYCY